MFPSSNCNQNPFESFSKRPSFLSDQNPSSSKQELDADPPFLFNFPSPFLDEHELPLNQIFLQNQPMSGNYQPVPDQITDKNTDHHPSKRDINPRKRNIGSTSKLDQKETGQPQILRRRTLGVIPRRRTGKKDRHSKICTAQGIRDRRMRLSLQVARKFFDLQDMLGYDKASKTIEWLFTKSKKAIRELTKGHLQANNICSSDGKSESFVSECEVVSGIEENNNSNNDVKVSLAAAANVMPLSEKILQKSSVRESREKARARARSRTREKMMNKNSGQWYNKSYPSTDHIDFTNLQKLGFSNSPFEGLVDQESNSQERVSSYGAVYTDVGTIENLLGYSTSCCPAAVSGYIDPNFDFMGFLGNWDLLSNDRINTIHHAGNPNSIYSETPKFP